MEASLFLRAGSVAETIEEWLVARGLKGAPIVDIVDAVCQRLSADGFPLAQAAIRLRLLHPQYSGICVRWRRDIGGAETEHLDHRNVEPAASPLAHLARSDGDMVTLRRRLQEPSCPRDSAELAELARSGATDVFCALVPTDEMAPPHGLMTSWATDRPGGFSDAEILRLERLLPVLALAVKASAAPRAVRSLLAIYLGHDAGARVLAGTVRRGATQSIDAVLCYADLAGFTGFADRADREALIATLDLYFEQLVTPIEHCGGQILKFMGDGLLATFALADFDGDAEQAVAAALDAAEEAVARVEALNARRRAAGEVAMDLDLALHLGEVHYGNVGTDERMDFTVIGPAVNEAARFEALCSPLNRRILASAAFAKAAGRERHRLESVGSHELRGVSEAQELFGLAARPPQ
jgi:adenylate cyclase